MVNNAIAEKLATELPQMTESQCNRTRKSVVANKIVIVQTFTIPDCFAAGTYKKKLAP